jgi:hypothetical protein
MTPPRIYCIPASEAPIVAVLRRGPSAWAHVGRWDLERGKYEPGAWLHARLYARRADLSPDGRYLCYLALDPGATWEHGDAYIAISRLPWLTALHAFGSCGTHTRGYHFLDAAATEEAAETGEAAETDEAADPLPIPWRLAPTPAVQFATERRCGWEEARDSPPRLDGDFWDVRRNARMRKPQPNGRHVLTVRSMGVAGGEFGVEQAVDGLRVAYALESGGSNRVLEDAQWADWDARGRLLVATRQGALQVRDAEGAVLEEHDLAEAAPAPGPPPEWAHAW